MLDFEFYTPTRMIFGKDTQKQVGKIVKEYGFKKVLVHFGGASAKKSGLLDQVTDALKAEGIDYVMLGGVQANPTLAMAKEGIALCQREGVDLVLAVGGGSVIDSAKAIAMGVPYDGDFWDFFMGGKVPTSALPLGSVLTIAAAGSECSNSCVIDREVNGIIKKKGCNFQTNVAKFAIMNPELTMTLPPFQTACGCCDIMCHIMERYFTNTKEVEVTDQLCEGLLRAMVAMIPRVMKDPNDYEARANIMWTSSLAHNNLCGVDREQDWASHRIEHELSALYDCAHGAGLAVVMPAWMDYVYKHDIMRFAKFANRVFGCAMDFSEPENTAKNGIKALRNLWKEAKLPLNFEELGAKKKDIPILLNNIGDENHTEGHFVVLSKHDIEAILNIAAEYQS